MAVEQQRFGADDARRTEDEPLLAGRGRFTDDLAMARQSFAHFVRSPVAHAEIRGINVEAAKTMPGVLAVVTGAELAAEGIGAIPPLVLLPGRDGETMFGPAMPVLAHQRVRYVGEPMAVVVAETAAQAADAAEAVIADLDPLPVASTVAAALATDAPVIWDEAPGNVALDWTDGDAAAVAAAFDAAAHVARVTLADTRVAPVAMEPRAAVGEWDPQGERYTLTASTQGVAVVRRLFAENVFDVPAEAIRVVTNDVGGGFGMKVQAYPEYAALLIAARRVGRPVRWTASRLESFLADTHGRDGELEGELALDASGKFLALRVRTAVGIGAYCSTFAAVVATNNTKNCLSSVYSLPAIGCDVRMMLTNAAPLGPYRGAGRPEAIYLIERLIDRAAAGMGIDRVELRRRNMIAPAAMPYAAPNGMIYDSGEFEVVLDKALALADWDGFAPRRAASEAAGRLRGIGLCSFLEVAGGSPLQESADLRFEADGKAVLRTGAQAMGQGQMTVMPRIVAAQLGISPDEVRVIQGDSDEVPAGLPTVASRSTMMAGGAIVLACDEAIDKGKELAGHFLEAAAVDIEYGEGRFKVGGTDRAIGIMELAAQARAATNLPEGLAAGMDTVSNFTTPQMSFPNGCHVCEVEIDPDTGVVEIVGYTAVDDVGNVLHETIVEGQIHGGVAQGLGQVLGERMVYDDDGQLLTASFMDYMMPRADQLPMLRIGHHAAPCMTNPLGVKGAGESGVAGSIPSAVNAILDALSSRGVTELDLPMTSERVWSALRQASRT